MNSIRAEILLCSIALVLSFITTGNPQQKTVKEDSAVQVSKLTGSWTGALDVGAVRLRLVFNLTEND